MAEKNNKILTGIEGLDKALNNGIPEGNIVLVSGGAGTGKSTFCLQFLVNGAKRKEKGLYISTEQTIEELKKQAENFGWNLTEFEKNNLIKIEYFDVTVQNNFFKRVTKIIEEFKPNRIAIDSLSTLTDTMLITNLAEETAFSLVQIAETVSPVPRTEQIITKSILFKLIQTLKKFKITSLLTSELYEGSNRLSADGVSEFICDGVILLSYSFLGLNVFRTLTIRKMRYTDHKKNPLTFEFTKNGIIIKEEEIAL